MLVIVHISDIHFESKGACALEGAAKLAEDVSAALRSVTVEEYDCLFVVTGDIAAHGQAEEYAVAERFLGDLERNRKEHGNLRNTWVLVVPGNHDCDLSVEEDVRETFLSGLGQRAPTDNVKRTLLKWQSAFAEFQAKVMQVEVTSTILSKTASLACSDGMNVHVTLLNSAWMSTRHEKQGELIPPEVPAPLDAEATLRIAAFHHPYSWYRRGPDRAFRSDVESAFDIVFTGHEHDGESATIARREVSTLYLDGELFVDPTTGPNAFRVLKCDLTESSAEEIVFRHDGKAFGIRERRPVRLNHAAGKSGGRQKLSAEQEQYLANPGAQVRHPRKDEVSLDDLFVAPSLRHERPGRKGGGADVRVLWSWKDVVKAKTLLLGPQHSGRTSICKQAFKEAYAEGLVPVMLDGRLLKKPTDVKVRAAVDEAYAKQYARADSDAFQQLTASRRAIIVDNWDACPVRNRKEQSTILDLLARLADRLLVCACDTFIYNVSDDELAEIITTGLEWYRILPFGHAKREQLARKWIELGRASEVTELEVDQQVAETADLLDKLVGTNVVPSFPFVVLLFLSLIETEAPTSTATGSYGYLYDALMTKVLSARPLNGVSLDTQTNYLADLAYHLQRRPSALADHQEALAWHQKYCSKYRVQLDYDRMVEHLRVGGVLSPTNGQVGFRFAYTRAYYVARYLGRNMDQAEVREYIVFLGNRVHLTDAANILMFLCYHTRDPFIIDTLVQASRAIFSRHGLCDFVQASEFVCGLVGSPPKLEQRLRDSSPGQNRIERARGIDEQYPTVVTDDGCPDIDLGSEPALSELDESFQVVAAFRSIQLLGQILRNFSGSTLGETKAEIAFECYALGLRLLSFIVSKMRERQEVVLQRLGAALKSRLGDKVKSEREAAAGLLYVLLAGCGCETIEHIVTSLGQRDLLGTYADVREKAEKEVSSGALHGLRIIDVVMTMRQQVTFPQQAVVERYKSLEHIAYGRDVLRMCVRWHFDYRTVPREIRQSVCSRLKIDDARARKMPQLKK